MTRGKAWSVEEVLRLKELVEAGVPISGIAVCLSKSRAAVGNKLSHLGLRDGGFRVGLGPSSSRAGLELPVDLPTVEDAAKVLAGAMLAMAKPGVSKSDVYRWKALADVAWKYKECMADLVRYRVLEREIVELRRKFVERAGEKPDFSAR